MTYKPAHVLSMAHFVLACRHAPAVAVRSLRRLPAYILHNLPQRAVPHI